MQKRVLQLMVNQMCGQPMIASPICLLYPLYCDIISLKSLTLYKRSIYYLVLLKLNCFLGFLHSFKRAFG